LIQSVTVCFQKLHCRDALHGLQTPIILIDRQIRQAKHGEHNQIVMNLQNRLKYTFSNEKRKKNNYTQKKKINKYMQHFCDNYSIFFLSSYIIISTKLSSFFKKKKHNFI
jgi:hypothetical protein